jgi:Reverse transcriptase (RNA-dependent DNA polymerase)
LLPQQKFLGATLEELLNARVDNTHCNRVHISICERKKSDGIYKMFYNYVELNGITVKDVYPVPAIDTLLQRTREFNVLSQIDLGSAYYKVGVTESTERFIAFRCVFGTYKYQGIPFGMTNTPSYFQRLLDTVLAKHLYVSLFVYLDEILIATEITEQNMQEVSWVLDTLAINGFREKRERCVCLAWNLWIF